MRPRPQLKSANMAETCKSKQLSLDFARVNKFVTCSSDYVGWITLRSYMDSTVFEIYNLNNDTDCCCKQISGLQRCHPQSDLSNLTILLDSIKQTLLGSL